MELALFKTLWGHRGSLDEAVRQCRDAGFQGIEGPAPIDPASREEFFHTMKSSGLEWIAEVSTCTIPWRSEEPAASR